MDIQFFTILLTIIIMFLSIVGLFIWNRTEFKADIRHMDNKIDFIRELVHAIHSEIKDFHNRLCAIKKGMRND